MYSQGLTLAATNGCLNIIKWLMFCRWKLCIYFLFKFNFILFFKGSPEVSTSISSSCTKLSPESVTTKTTDITSLTRTQWVNDRRLAQHTHTEMILWVWIRVGVLTKFVHHQKTIYWPVHSCINTLRPIRLMTLVKLIVFSHSSTKPAPNLSNHHWHIVKSLIKYITMA